MKKQVSAKTGFVWEVVSKLVEETKERKKRRGKQPKKGSGVVFRQNKTPRKRAI